MGLDGHSPVTLFNPVSKCMICKGRQIKVYVYGKPMKLIEGNVKDIIRNDINNGYLVHLDSGWVILICDKGTGIDLR